VRSVQLGDLNGAVAIGIIQAIFLIGMLSALTKFGRHHTSPLTVNIQVPKPTGSAQKIAVTGIAITTGFLALLPLIAVAWKSTLLLPTHPHRPGFWKPSLLSRS